MASFTLRRPTGGSHLRGGDALRDGASIGLGSIDSAEDVPGPRLARLDHLSLAPIDGEPNVPGPVLRRPADPELAPEFAGRISVHVYDRANAAPVVELEDRLAGAGFQDVMADAGTGKTALANDDADLALVGYGDVLRFEIDGVFEFASRVEIIGRADVSPEEEAGEATELAGRGTLAIFENGIVYPDSTGSIFSERRVFNFASTDLEDSAFGPVLSTSILSGPVGGISTGVAPRGWPDATAEKIWIGYPPATGFATPGDVYVRRWFTLVTGGTFRLSWTGDDAHELWLDGVLLGRSEVPFGFLETTTVDVRLSAGVHLLAMRGTNGAPTDDGSGNEAWLLATLQEIDADGSLGNVIVHTDSSWVGVGYPADPPGFTVGEVLRILLEEAQARGSLLAVSFAFSDAVDSGGRAWGRRADLAFEIGRNLLLVLRQLADEGLVERYRMRPVGLVLETYVEAGQATSVSYHRPTDDEDPYSGNLTDLRRDGSIV